MSTASCTYPDFLKKDECIQQAHELNAMIRELHPRHDNETVWSLAFSPKCRFLGTGSADGTAKVFRLRPEAHLAHRFFMPKNRLHQDCVVGGCGVHVDTRNSDDEGLDQRNEVFAVDFLSEDEFVTASMDGAVRIWSVPDGILISQFAHNHVAGEFVRFAVSSQRRLFASVHSRILTVVNVDTFLTTRTGIERYLSPNDSTIQKLVFCGLHDEYLAMFTDLRMISVDVVSCDGSTSKRSIKTFCTSHSAMSDMATDLTTGTIVLQERENKVHSLGLVDGHCMFQRTVAYEQKVLSPACKADSCDLIRIVSMNDGRATFLRWPKHPLDRVERFIFDDVSDVATKALDPPVMLEQRSIAA